MKRHEDETFLKIIASFDGLESHLKMYLWAITFIEKNKLWSKFCKYSERKLKEEVWGR